MSKQVLLADARVLGWNNPKIGDLVAADEQAVG